MKNPKYEEALTQVTKTLQDNYPWAQKTDDLCGNLAQAFPKGIAITERDRFGGVRGIALVPDEDRTHIKELLERASTSTQAFDTVQAWVYGHLLFSGIVPQDETAARAARLVAQHSLGVRVRPKGTAGRKKKEIANSARHAVLRLAVKEAEAFGFHVNKNDASSDVTSACDIVANAMAALNFQPTASKTIEKIFRDGEAVRF